MTTRWIRSSTLLVAAGLLAGCTSTGGVATTESNTEAAPASTSPPPETATNIDGSTPIVEPTAAGLPELDDPDPAIVAGVLDNGLRYLIRENDNPGGTVEMRLVVDAGAALQGDDQVGGAHFLEHMLFNGTEKFPENELIAVLRSFGAGFGADINAYTSYDETVYELSMPTADPAVVATGLDVLEQWLSAATLDAAAVEDERGVVLDEWRTREQSADGRIFDEIEELFLADTDYEGQDPIGTDAAITTTVAEPLRRFYDDWYRPDNVAVVVVGDIDADGIEQGIAERFGPAASRGSSPDRIELIVAPSSEPRARVLVDPDIAQGFAFVNLPLAAGTVGSQEELIQWDLLDRLAFSIIETRLDNAVLLGDAPMEDAYAGSSGVVRSLDAPEIGVDADGAEMVAAVQAVLDEFERVRRFGFTSGEVARAVAAERSELDSVFAGRNSRQDRSFAEEYVEHVLEGTPIPTAESRHELSTAILDRATPETIAHGLVTRLSESGPHILVVVPDGEAATVPAADDFEEMARTVGTRQLDPVDDDIESVAALMATPAPVEERSQEMLADGGSVSFVRPLLLTFDNGVTVSLNPTPIVEGAVALNAASPGGLAVVPNDDVADAIAAGPVVDDSGLGDFGVVELETFLASEEVELVAYIDLFTEGFDGFAATSDLEVLLQLVHLRMTEPRVDAIALERYLDSELPYARDRELDPVNAEFFTLLDARYDDERFLLPTVETLATVDADGIERVFRDRFGDAGDWVFALSGDFDLDTAVELSRRYLGTLPATERNDDVDFAEPPPPAGIVVEQANAGQGDTATVSFLFTAPAGVDRRDDVAARIVQEVVSARLTDSIREELGESYSPFASVQLTAGSTPNVETYISVSAAPDRVDAVSAAVRAQLDDLRAGGPTTEEHSAATEKVGRDLSLFTNPSINAEVLAVLVDPAGNSDFAEYLGEAALVETISPDEIRAYMAEWLTVDQYIEVRVLPR